MWSFQKLWASGDLKKCLVECSIQHLEPGG